MEGAQIAADSRRRPQIVGTWLQGYVLQVRWRRPTQITVTEAHPFPVVLGRALSLIGLGGLAVVFGSIAVGARRRRRAAV